MTGYRSVRDLDWPLLIVTLALCALGVLQIYSATVGTKWSDAWWKQIIWVGTGLAMMWVAAMFDYHVLLTQITYLYLTAMVVLAATTFAGSKVFGSTRWIKIGGFTLQTSEFVKIVLILAVARYLTEMKNGTSLTWGDLGRLAPSSWFPWRW